MAALARLRLPEEDLAVWTGQLGRILSYIGQLERDPGRPEVPEPALLSTPFRADSPVEGGGRPALETNAPALAHGYGSVPRVVGSLVP